MLKQLITIFAALLCYATAYATYPSGDYNFTCTAQNSIGQAALKIEAGVDPSGGFYTEITASGPYNKLNGISYMSEILSGPKGYSDFYKSAPYIKPGIAIFIDWLKEVRTGFYHGILKRHNFNNGQPVNLLCSYKEQ